MTGFLQENAAEIDTLLGTLQNDLKLVEAELQSFSQGSFPMW